MNWLRKWESGSNIPLPRYNPPKSDRLLEGETSNRLFQTLEEWNEFLKKFAPFFKEVA